MLALAIIRMPDYNYTDMICRKDLGVMEYMSCPEAAKKWGISERQVQVLCRKPHTGCFKTWIYVADTKGRGKTD